MARVLVGMVALLVALATHVVGAAWTFFETCRISDTADRVPAPASVQGRFCDAQDQWLNVAPFVVFGASILIAVVLAVTWWGTGRRWLGREAVRLRHPGERLAEPRVFVGTAGIARPRHRSPVG